jgi:hypothetical protein
MLAFANRFKGVLAVLVATDISCLLVSPARRVGLLGLGILTKTTGAWKPKVRWPFTRQQTILLRERVGSRLFLQSSCTCHEELLRRAISIVFASRRSKLITQGTLANNILSGGLVKWFSGKL